MGKTKKQNDSYLITARGIFFDALEDTLFVPYKCMHDLMLSRNTLNEVEKDLFDELLLGYKDSWFKYARKQQPVSLDFRFEINGLKESFSDKGQVTQEAIHNITNCLMRTAITFRTYPRSLYDTLLPMSKKERNQYLSDEKESLRAESRRYGFYQILSSTYSSVSYGDSFFIGVKHTDNENIDENKLKKYANHLDIGLTVRVPPADLVKGLNKYIARCDRYRNTLITTLSTEERRHKNLMTMTYDEFKEWMKIKNDYQFDECLEMLNGMLADEWRSTCMTRAFVVKTDPKENQIKLSYRFRKSYLTELEKGEKTN